MFLCIVKVRCSYIYPFYLWLPLTVLMCDNFTFLPFPSQAAQVFLRHFIQLGCCFVYTLFCTFQSVTYPTSGQKYVDPLPLSIPFQNHGMHISCRPVCASCTRVAPRLQASLLDDMVCIQKCCSLTTNFWYQRKMNSK